MSDIKLCKECWYWVAPKYAARPGKCVLGIYEKPYEDTRACDEIINLKEIAFKCINERRLEQ